MADIFISYARDDRVTAQRIAEALAACGLSVWWDRKVAPGMSYEDAIEQELASAKGVLVLWSKASVVSSWVRNEAAEALERGKLIPVLIESVKVPIAFRHMQTSDLSSWNSASTNPEWDAVIERVGQLQDLPPVAVLPVAMPPATPAVTAPVITAPPTVTAPAQPATLLSQTVTPQPPTPVPPKPEPGPRARRVALVGGGVVLGVIILAILISRSGSSDDSSDESSADSNTTSSLNLSSTESAYGTQTLTPGFEPDPVSVTVRAGGGVNITPLSLGAGCVGWTATKPDVIVDLTKPGTRLRFYATASSDTAIAVLDPSGAWQCDDDTGGNSNPDLTLEPSTAGLYRIWVPTYGESMTDATLQITERAKP